MDSFMDYLNTMDYVSLTLVALPIVAIILCGFLLMGKSKNDTMQRNGSKASHNTKSQKDSHHQHHQTNSKNDSSDSGISTNGHHHHPHHQQQSAKQRKSRSNSKRQDGSAGQKRATGFSVDDWLGRDMVYCYDRRFLSSCGEEKMIPLHSHNHNPIHRNSTSSETAASDDLNSSSNEDLSAAYAVMAQNNKKPTKSRQKRQQKRKQMANNQANANSTNSRVPVLIDIDMNMKENQRPTNFTNGPQHQHQYQNQQQQQQHGKGSGNNLRKQCTKTAALKTINKNVHSANKCHGPNGLNTSPSTSSVCSTLSAGSSNFSIPSSVSSSASNSPLNSANCSPTASPTITKRSCDSNQFNQMISRALTPPLRQYPKFQLNEYDFVQQLRRNIIDPNLLRVYGFPVESAIHEGCVEIYKCLPKPFDTPAPKPNVININDGLYTNQFSANIQIDQVHHASGDSGQGSGDSSPRSVDSDSSEVADDEPTGTTAFYTPDGTYQIFSQYDHSVEKQCVRCHRNFHVTDDGEYLSHENCYFHWGKKNHMYTSNSFGLKYSCCRGEEGSLGCTVNPLHVWSGAAVGINGPFTDFVHTRPCYNMERRHPKVYALDCEMSFTGRGLEVTKVTVIGFNGELVYEHFVRPDVEIVDYNTRFSGITAEDFTNNVAKSLREVQRDLLQLFDADTILIGHGLDNDLRVLRIVHKTIIDTSVAFPHTSGFPYRRSLKHLAKVFLNRDIQSGSKGHCSYEDSRACLDVMIWKVRKDMLKQSYV